MYKDTLYLLLIISIFISAVIETDIYLPAFADMMHYFAQDEENIQKILTWNFIGLCVSGIIYGPISDSYGRKKPLIIALTLFFLGSLITVRADNFNLLLLGRIFQGLGSGGCFTLGTAIIFDVFQKEKATDALNKINVIVPFIMASAPLLGGYLNQHFGFRANFYAIAICVFLCLTLCVLFLKETLVQSLKIKFDLKQIASNITKVIKHIQFLQLTIVISLLFAGFLCFLSTTAVLFVTEFNIPKNKYPYYQCTLLIAYLIASLSCGRLIKRFGIFFVKKIGLFSLIISSCLLCITSYVYPENTILLTLTMLPYAAGFIWVQTPYVTEVMELIPEVKGIAASILTSFRLLITAGIVGTAASYYDATVMPTTIIITIISFLVCTIFIYYERSKIRKTHI